MSQDRTSKPTAHPGMESGRAILNATRRVGAGIRLADVVQNAGPIALIGATHLLKVQGAHNHR
eukprot:1735825-Amphidinium_carterae.1